MRLPVLPLLGLLALAACPSFAVGPEAFELLERDEATCEAAELGPAPCSRFEVDNGVLFNDVDPQPLQLRFGFESTERNLSYLSLSYERPGQAPVEQTCDFGIYEQDPQGSPELRCYRVTLSNTGEDEASGVATTARGVLDVDLDVLADEAGPYAVSMWLTDDNGFESPTIRWQFTVREPERE